MSARGPLIAIGGAEDRSDEADILKRVIDWSGKSSPVVGVITTASAIPDEVFRDYHATFGTLGAAEVLDIRVRDRTDAADDGFIDLIGRADVIFISGGDQMRLTNVFGGSAALAMIRSRHAQGAVVAGTSAGAACQSRTMVYGGSPDDSLRKGAVKMAAGFGFVDGVIIDTHFLQRGRFSRLMEVGATNPEYLGVGLGEDAAVLFEGDLIRAIGPGHVILVDSSSITGSNVFDLDDGEAVTVHNVTMHALINGYGYSLRERRVIAPSELEEHSTEQSDAYT
ncbi:cyanophycinase [uncultured Jannaschia sp.]|uniref:cyanophycinase n=1 Tax=uncultured Jannaschia sp. TaxID=293347 RepID=UPI0026082A15|nr:cyanophycinase [uncultured Jannaschia sp.]